MITLPKEKRERIISNFERWPENFNFTGINFQKVEECSIKNGSIDNFWLISTITSVLFHMNDIPYYDGKISILFWILIAGVKCIISQKKSLNEAF